MSIYKIIEQLKNTSGRNDKIAILQANKENELLKRVILMTLDPFLQFYIRKIPEYQPTSSALRPMGLPSSLDMLSKLSNREVTGHEGIEHLRMILSNSTEEDAKVIELIIGKDLKCGVAESTVNKVWDNLIHEFPCMLCSKKDDKTIKNITFPALSQKKSDGARCTAIVKDGKVTFHSRSGRPIDVSKQLEDEILLLGKTEALMDFGMTEYAVDGELLIRSGSVEESRKIGNGIINQALKGTISDINKARICFDVWDVIPLKDFENGHSQIAYHARALALDEACIDVDAKKVKFIETTFVVSLEEAYDDFQRYAAQGYEGTILKNLDAPWEDKRSKHAVKFKNEFECELRVIGIEEGTGKYVGMMGALRCESQDGVLKVSVGTGFSDEMRQTINTLWIDKIITVKYNERIQNEAGEWSLFLPVFVKERLDKSVANLLEEIE